jgi:RimJ/RimL family protein N-acetyltransferase
VPNIVTELRTRLTLLSRRARLLAGEAIGARVAQRTREAGHLGGDRRVTSSNELNPASALSSDHPAAGAPAGLVREGNLVRLRPHVVENRPAFQRWYADEEIARLLRHDQRPLNEVQSRGYFDTIIMPLSARGMCFAIHEAATDRLIGTTALTDVRGTTYRSALFRIVIGEKECWGRGYGTEATRLVTHEAFDRLDLHEIRLEVFRHNDRAIAAYRRVGFHETGEHVEFVGRERFELHVIEMALDRDDFRATESTRAAGGESPSTLDRPPAMTTAGDDGNS